MANTRNPGSAEPRPDPGAHVRGFLAARLAPGARIALGYSGGLDSSVLLHILATLRDALDFKLEAVHVHHGLSAHADAWADACACRCAALGVPLGIERVRVAPCGQGVEAAARVARYGVYTRLAVDAILLAHHLDDQVETFFMRLLRGAGVRGLAAMQEDGLHEGRRMLRPLLGVPRAALEDYARQHGLDHVEDGSNDDTRLTRNFIRHACLPTVAARFPAYRQTLLRDIAQLREADSLLETMAREDLARIATQGHPKVSALIALGEARARNVLRHWLRVEARVDAASAPLGELWHLLVAARPDAQPLWQLGGVTVRRHRDHLHLLQPNGACAPGPVWRGEAELRWPGLGHITFEPTAGGLSEAVCRGRACRLGLRAGGERLRPDARRPARGVKDLLREAGVPAWERARIPMLFVDGELAWVAGLGIDCRFQAADGAPGWLISWRPHP